jgi:hypothetical protein
MNVFIGGSRKISKINEAVRARLRNIIEQGFTVLIGDANGADKAVQSYFSANNYSNVAVYCSGLTWRNNIGNWEVTHIEPPAKSQGVQFYTAKDIRMSEDADYGFMLWDGRSAGTLNNISNLLKQNKKTLLYYAPGKTFHTIAQPDDLQLVLKVSSTAVVDVAQLDKKTGLAQKLREVSAPRQMRLPL